MPGLIYDLMLGLFFLPFGGEAKVRRKMVQLLEVKEGEEVLELGCGTARLSQFLLKQEKALELFALDLSPSMLSRACQNLAREKVSLILADASQLPFAEQCFDHIITSLSLHEMPTSARLRAIQECYRVLRKSGRLTVIEYRSPDQPFLKKIDSLLGLLEPSTRTEMLKRGLGSELKSAGFSLIKTRALGFGVFEVLWAVKP